MIAVSPSPESVDASPLITKLDVSKEDWEATPAPVRRGVQRLWDELQRLREQVGQTSQNSSKPPSSDPPSAPKRESKAPTGRAAGGQHGHADTNRPLVPEDQLTVPPIPCHPPTCQHCGSARMVADGASPPERHQVVEVPPVVATVTEFQLFTDICLDCGLTTKATLPPGVPTGGYGPVVTGMVSLFTGAYHLGKRAVAELMSTCFQVPISIASVQRIEQTISVALEPAWQEAHAAVQAAAHVNLDETGWDQQREPDPDPDPAAPSRTDTASPPPTDTATPPSTDSASPDKLHRAWLWVAVCHTAIVFLIRRSRGNKVVKELLGATFAGGITSDRWTAYNFFAALRRQLCWAHLLRDFTKMAERGGVAARIGTALLEQAHQMFTLWFRVRDGTLTHAEFQQQMEPIQAAVLALLTEGATTAGPSTATTCQWLLDHRDALWTFVRVAGIDPTNNGAEQAIRIAVIWRKLCFGTQTSAGSRYVERMLTVVATCRLHQRPVLEYLTAVATAAYAGQPSPALLPIPTPSV